MNLATLKPLLVTWVSTQLGVDSTVVVWQNAPRPQSVGVLVTLSIVSTTGIGIDETRWDFTSDPAPALNATATTQRLWTMRLQVSVESFDQTPGNGALEVAQGLRDAWRAPSSVDFLAAQNIAVRDVKEAIQRDYPVQGRWISRAITEVRINAASAYTDTRGATNTLEHVGIVGTVTDESGTPYPPSLQVNETMP